MIANENNSNQSTQLIFHTNFEVPQTQRILVLTPAPPDVPHLQKSMSARMNIRCCPLNFLCVIHHAIALGSFDSVSDLRAVCCLVMAQKLSDSFQIWISHLHLPSEPE